MEISNKLVKLNNGIFDSKLSKLSLILMFLAIIFGSLIMFMPILYIFLFLITVYTVIFLILKPKYCYYLIIFTIPITFRLRFLPISFSINDISILLCAFSILLNLIFVDKKINFRTGIDKWIITLMVLFFLAGITSVNPIGILTSFKFFEALLVFYLTIYFVRTKKINVSDVIRVLIITSLFQATLGVLQSITGGLGADFQSDRGYLGRLGIGSTLVWHGHGTMEHFNGLGNYLTAVVLFFVPIYYYICRKNIKGKIILGLLLWGLITTYSRGSLLGIFAGFIYFISQIIKNKLKFTIVLISCFLFIGIIYLFLSQTSYIETLNPRNRVWEGVIAAISSSARYLWLGAGLNSYEIVVPQFLPPDEQWFAHNFYLICTQEMGIIGAAIFFSFLISMLITTRKKFRDSHGLLRVINLSASLAILSIFFVSMFDHSYYLTYFKIFIFLLLGIIYAKDKNFG